MIYVINEVDGTLEIAHKLQVSTKNFPGKVLHINTVLIFMLSGYISGEATLPFSYLPPFSALERIGSLTSKLFPFRVDFFWKDLVIQGCKQVVTKIVPPL